MGRGERDSRGGTDAAAGSPAPRMSQPYRRAPRAGAARRLLAIVPLCLALFLALAAGASAQAPAPGWELISNHAPTNIPQTAPLGQVFTFEVADSPNVGKFYLAGTVAEKEFKTHPLPYNASPEQVQNALEVALKVTDSELTVTGDGPTEFGQSEWKYTITFTGTKFLGKNVVEMEAESIEATSKEINEVEARPGEPSSSEGSFSAEEIHESHRNTVIYELIPINHGAAPSSGTSTVTDTLPAGLVTEATPSSRNEKEWECTPGEGNTKITCTSTVAVNPDAVGEPIFIDAYANPAMIEEGEQLTNHAEITGGGSKPAKAEPDTALVSNTPAKFGVHDFKAAAYGPEGEIDTKAGDHPYAATTTFLFNTIARYVPFEHEYQVVTPGNLKDADVVLPEGFIGNPAGGRTRCPEAEFLLNAKGEPGEAAPTLGCAAETQVGTVSLLIHPFEESVTEVPLYNLVPPAGVPAEFGFMFLNTPVRLDAHVRRIHGHYRVTVLSSDINEAFNINGISLTLWGVPADSSHNAERNQTENHSKKGAESKEEPHRPFLTNPADCLTQAEQIKEGQDPITSMFYDQWEIPGALNADNEPSLAGGEAAWHEGNSEPLPAVTGCQELKFEPKVAFGPTETNKAAAPSGYQFGLEIPQSESVGTPGTPQLKDTTVTLPAGVSLSPSAANGLESCNQEGPESIELESTALGHCPSASQVGEVHIKSSLLEEELTGRVFIGKPGCSPCHEQDDLSGNLFRLFIEAEAPHSGVRIKLPGTAVAGTPATQAAGGLKVGQVKTTFDGNPQFPFTTLKLTLKGGQRATLANPPACGTYTTSSLLTPWSLGGSIEGTEIPGATLEETKPPATFETSWDGAGAPCPAGTLPFAPSLAAGTENSAAGAYSPLVTVFKRPDDREQDLSGITVQTPPGLLGKIAGVSKCEVAPTALEKEEATCPANSRIAIATTAAGSGSTPFVVNGPVYLTGATSSAATGASGPFGLDIVVPAVAGPFNLGTIVVHAVIDINKSTSAITITSDPLPQSLDGVPFRVKEVQVRVDRPEFTFNPTNCESGAGHEISATFTGAPQREGEPAASSHASVPMTASGCAALPFNPTFTASSNAHTSKKLGATLTVRVAQQPGEAHIRKVELQLPEALPSQLETLHKACPDYVFEANPANCPEGSYVGTAKAITPLLNVPLTGPAILVSHANREFPDLVYLLQGEGVHIELVGNTYIAHGITYSKFETVPDAPISTFETTLPTGPHALLTAYGNICEKELFAPTTIVSQSNKEVVQKTRINVSECPPYVKITATKASASRLVVTIKLSQAGNVKLSGRGVTTATKRGLGAGTHQVTLALTSLGKADAKRHKKLSLTATVTVGTQTASTTTTAKA